MRGLRAGALALVHGDRVQRVLGEAYARRGRVFAARQVGEGAQGIGGADAKAAVGLVEGNRVGREGGANLTQACAHGVDALLVDDRSGVLHGARHAGREGATRIRVAIDVRDDVGQPKVG